MTIKWWDFITYVRMLSPQQDNVCASHNNKRKEKVHSNYGYAYNWIPLQGINKVCTYMILWYPSYYMESKLQIVEILKLKLIISNGFSCDVKSD